MNSTSDMVPGKPRFQVLDESASAHCCFVATVLDTSQRLDFRDPDNPRYEVVCECFEYEHAEKIASALNQDHPRGLET